MTITKVKYERLFPCGSYLNEKIGFEAELGVCGFSSIDTSKGMYVGEETPNIVIEQLRQLAENIHKEKYPQYYVDNESSQNVNPETKPKSTLQSIIEEMNKVDAIDKKNSFGVQVGLLAYADKFLDSTEFREAYDKKLNELS